ncbi:MAG: 50S ribosomal protein L10 [Planctomycetota bacterium]|jgi:large subunit ribosomal protein L10
MPNLVNEILLEDLKQKFEEMDSCVVVSFDKLTVEQANDVRNQFRDAGLNYFVVKNRLALQVLKSMGLEMRSAFEGKCAVAFAKEEGAISAAKLVREFNKPFRKAPPMRVTGGVIEGEVIIGDAAKNIADMPDKQTVRGQLASALSGLARGIVVCLSGAGPAGLARVLQAKIDKEGGDS